MASALGEGNELESFLPWMIASLRRAAERLEPQPWSYDSKVNLSLWMLSLLGVEADWDSEFIAISPL